jgi:hypothetical protein
MAEKFLRVLGLVTGMFVMPAMGIDGPVKVRLSSFLLKRRAIIVTPYSIATPLVLLSLHSLAHLASFPHNREDCVVLVLNPSKMTAFSKVIRNASCLTLDRRFVDLAHLYDSFYFSHSWWS